jgi:dTDP-4-amino-4,6-dideoxygalactose transaminase
VWIEPERRNHFGGRHYPVAIPDQKAMSEVEFEAPDGCENARRLCASEVSLPVHPYLNDAEVAEVIAAVNSF